MSVPKFYDINFEREFVFQGNDTSFLTIKNNTNPNDNVWVYIWVQPQTLNIDNTLENRNINNTFPTPPWIPPTPPPGNPNVYKYDTDDNFYINGINAADFANTKQAISVGAGSTLSNNPTDGSTPIFYNRGGANRWHLLDNPDDEITYRVDYDGQNDAHLKVVLLFYKGANPGNDLKTYLQIAALTSPPGTDIPFGLKDNHFKETNPAITLDNFDYQELHFFGYKESYVRPTREIYQNLYKTVDNPIYDDKSSFGLLRTNPKLTGNVKISVDSNGQLWLNSIDANDELSASRYKKFPISPNSTYQKDLSTFMGSVPSDIMYDLFQVDDQYLNTKRTASEQYDNFYTYGVEQLKSKFYDEDFSFFAPLWIRKNLPDYFVILRLPHPVEEESYDSTIAQDEQLKNFFAKGDIVKTFDLRETSKLGTYLRKIVNDNRFIDRPIEVSYEKDNPTVWNGIDYAQGAITGKSEFLYDFYTTDRPILEFEEYITAGFQRNGIVSSNLMNLEFFFNDEEVKMYSINRYVGFYVNENELAEIEISGLGLQKNTEQTPAPKPGVDGEPYSNRTFIQSNPNGIVIPVQYYQGADREIGAEPEFTGTVSGKLPLPILVDDALRFFYIKDRKGNFKRIRSISEVEYGLPGTPDAITVSELRVGDSSEDIALYGGVNEIVSQFDSYLLDSSKSQLVINLENTKDDPQLILNEEEIEIIQSKLNHEVRDCVYSIIITGDNGLGQVTDYTWQELTNTGPIQSKTVTYPFVGPAVSDVDSFLTIEFDPASSYTAGDTWNISITDTDVIITNLPGTSGIVVKTFPHYDKFTWKMIANPIGLPTGGAFRYPTYDPDGYNNLSHFNPEGTPEQVAKSITECINSFENRIVDAYADGSKIILKSKIPFEDGNTISFKRSLQNDSVFDNVTFYESGLVSKTFAVEKLSSVPVLQDLNDSIIKFYEQDRYFLEYVSFIMTGSSLQVRLDIDPLFPLTTGTPQVYSIAGTDFIDVYRNGEIFFTVYTTQLAELFKSSGLPTTLSFVFRFDSNKNFIEQNFIGGVRRNRSRARVEPNDGKRFYYNDTVNGLVRANPTKITQQWFQVQKDKYSLLKGWEVQGQYVYSLPYLDEPIYDNKGNVSGYSRSEYDIIQVDSYNDEFFQTRDKKIVAYKVFRPSVGVFSVFPIKMFDTDTLFSDYSYTPTPEIFRYYTEEKLVSKVAYDSIQGANDAFYAASILWDPKITQYSYQKELDLFENWRLYINTELPDNTVPPTPPVNTGVATIKLEGWDGNTNTWVDLETINLKEFWSHDRFIFNTYFPVYFYNNEEIPNDNQWDLNNINSGTQFTMVGLRNYDKKTYELERNVFTKARITIIAFNDGAVSPIVPTEYVASFTIENNCYADDPDIKSFNGFAGLQDFTTEADEEYIQQLRLENNPERFTYQLLLSEYDRLRENFTKEWAVKSRVVPYVQKWVQEGTDARDNYYRLNNSSAFGITNFSPDSDVNFVEPLLLTHEFPYLDSFPKNYPTESVENSRLYFFNKLSDRVYDYEVNVLDDSALYFKEGLSIFNQDYKNDGYEKNYFYITIEGGVCGTLTPPLIPALPMYPDQWEYRINVWKYVDLENYKTTGIFMGSYPVNSTNNYVYEDKEFKIDLTTYKNTSGYVVFSVQSSDPRTWYDVLKNDNTDDWFSKYFSIGCPTELLPVNVIVPKNREERYTFFNFNNGISRSQTLFHGAKLQVIDIQPETLIENFDSRKYDSYKFSAVQRVVRKTNLVTDPAITYDESGKPIDLAKDEPPFKIEIIKNDKHKSILMILTVTQTDYRLQSGGSEYAFFYFAVNELKSHMQSQGITKFTYPDFLSNPLLNPYVALNMYANGYYTKDGVTNFQHAPYVQSGTTIPSMGSGSKEDYWYQISKLRNGFFGGGFLEIGDPKIRSIVNDINPVSSNLSIDTTNIKTGYDIPLYNDMFPSYDLIPNYKTNFGKYGIFGSDAVNFPSTGVWNTIQKNDANTNRPFFKNGYLNRIYATSYNLSYPYAFYNALTAVPNLSDTYGISFNNITFNNAYDVTHPVYSLNSRFISQYGFTLPADGIKAFPVNFSSPPTYIFTDLPGETFHLYGGNLIIDNKKQEYSFANIAQLINTSDDVQVNYYEITDNYVGETTSYKLKFVTFDKIVKGGKYYFEDDTDKPTEYEDTTNIGRVLVKTPEVETIFRHRGYYEPKVNEIISFWVREDEIFTSHFKKDYLLKNTRINNLSELSGMIRNVFYNKFAEDEVLKISRGSSYKSLYPYIDEVSIDNGNQLSILSTWDGNYYRKYTSTSDYSFISGINDMKEFKSWLASKTMNVPKAYSMETFNSNELTYEVIQAGTSIGVSQLEIGGTNDQSMPDANKPKLVINLDLESRLLRHMLEDLNNPLFEDEFLRLQSLTPAELNSLSLAQINSIKREYFTKNIIPLYEVSEVKLWINTTEGLQFINLSLSDAQKVSLGYTIDKNSLTQSNKNLQYNITKYLDTKQSQSFSVSVLIKRV